MSFSFSKRTGWPLEESPWARAAARARRGPGTIDLAESNPTRCAFRYQTPGFLAAFSDPSNLLYEPDPIGFAPARRAVSGYYAAKGADVPPGRVVLTAGTSEAYSFLLKLLLGPGQAVLAPAPGYPLLDHLADLCDARLARYPLVYDGKKGWSIDRAAFLKGLTPDVRAVVVVHPNNPTGHRTEGGDRAWLEDAAAERGLALIVDEVFLDFAFEAGARPESFASNRRALTFTLSGISKILGLPQMKLSWIAAAGPGPQVDAALSRLAVIADAYLSVSGPPQRALAGWLLRRDEALAEIGGRVRDNRIVLEKALAKRAGATGRPPLLKADGGWYAVLRLEGAASDEEASLALMEKGVIVQPGYLFDFPDERHLVLSLLPEPSAFAEGARRLSEFLV